MTLPKIICAHLLRFVVMAVGTTLWSLIDGTFIVRRRIVIMICVRYVGLKMFPK